jgi:DNA-binding transcriptional LysR family regulator
MPGIRRSRAKPLTGQRKKDTSMDIKQLQALLAIADHGSFSAAAKALLTVQSNVSAHIKRLENELGVTLVDRHDGSLTDEGEMVAQRARRVVHEIEDIDADIHSLGDSPSGEARIGAIGTTGRWLMPLLLPEVSARHPNVHITVFEGATSNLVPRISNGEIDAAIVHLPLTSGDFDVTELFAEELVVIAHTKHELADRVSISLAELAEHQVLLAPRGTALRRIVDRAAANEGVAMTALAEIDGVRLMTSLAFEGYGAAIVPASAIPGWLRGDFVRISVPGLPQRVVGWAQRHRPRPNRATLAVRDTLIDIIDRYGDRQPGVTKDVHALPQRVIAKSRPSITNA